MKLRHYLLMQGYVHAGLTVFCALLPVFVPAVDTLGWILLVAITGVFAWKAFACFKGARQARDEERAFSPPVDASTAEKVGYYKSFAVIGCIVFVFLSILEVVELNRIEQGVEADAGLLIPVSLAYRYAGYWGAAFLMPMMGLVSVGVFLWKVRQLGSKDKSRE